MSLKTVLITGLAGAGKSTALNAFEDMGYYCIDNLPCFLVEELLERRRTASRLDRLVLIMDSRDPLFFEELPGIVAALTRQDRGLRTFFLTADDEILIRRFSQMRRVHPLTDDQGLPAAIRAERQRFVDLLPAARQIDTSHLSPHELRGILRKACGVDLAAEPLPVTISSFGFKYGLPPEADLVWDVRFLPNPYFQIDLKAKTGKEAAVADFVLANDRGRTFLDLLEPLLSFLVPLYQQAGKISLHIAIGCTGGKHRSVAVSQRVAEMLSGLAIDLRISHRDIGKE